MYPEFFLQMKCIFADVCTAQNMQLVSTRSPRIFLAGKKKPKK